MKEKLRKEETTVFIGVSIALLEIISGREAVMKYNGTKQTAPITSVRIQKPDVRTGWQTTVCVPSAYPTGTKRQSGKTSVPPCPQQAEQLAVPKVGLDHRPEIRLRKERIHTLAMNTPNAGCRHIVRIYHRIEKLAEFERLEHQDNSGNEDRSVAPSAD